VHCDAERLAAALATEAPRMASHRAA
jgi:hypothetical protein